MGAKYLECVGMSVLVVLSLAAALMATLSANTELNQRVRAMNNKVKPQAGMMFKRLKSGDGWSKGDLLTVTKHISGVSFLGNTGGGSPNVNITTGWIHENFEFVPQNDLEWLAVNATWMKDAVEGGHKFVAREGEKIYWSKTGHNGLGWHLIERLIECRYKLGLDERPKQKTTIEFSAVLTRKNTMDLSGAVKEDKFESECQRTFTVAYVGAKESYWCMESETGRAYIFGRAGVDDVASVRLVKKHDPRPWLKDLPDASLFDRGAVVGIGKLKECDGGWWYFVHISDESGDDRRYLPLANMPDLTDEECETSEISIADLAKWQSDNP